jgi:sugar lactone lactonase YvrE
MTITTYKYILAIIVVLLPHYAFSAELLKFKHGTSLLVDEKGSALKYPEGVACTASSRIIVADTGNNRLVSYTMEEQRIKGGSEIKVAQLAVPILVQVNSKGDIFALDGKKHSIVHLTPEGAFAGTLEPQGVTGPSGIVTKSFKIDGTDSVYLLDIFSERVLILDPTGKVQKQLPFPANYGFISDLAVDESGTILLVDSVNNVVFSAPKANTVFTPLTQKLGEYADSLTYITVDKRGLIFLVDKDGGSLVILGQDGTFREHLFGVGVKNGLLNYPSQICLTATGDLLIADRANSRVQLFEMIK